MGNDPSPQDCSLLYSRCSGIPCALPIPRPHPSHSWQPVVLFISPQRCLFRNVVGSEWYSARPFQTGFLPCATCIRISLTSFHGSVAHFFLSLNNIPLSGCTTVVVFYPCSYKKSWLLPSFSSYDWSHFEIMKSMGIEQFIKWNVPRCYEKLNCVQRVPTPFILFPNQFQQLPVPAFPSPQVETTGLLAFVIMTFHECHLESWDLN